MSAFYIWNPHVSQDYPNVLDFILINGDIPSGIATDRRFIEQLLNDIGISINVESWTIVSFRSIYFSEYLDRDDWRDVWPIIWKVHVKANKQIENPPKITDLLIDTNASGSDWLDDPEDEDLIGCLVISDFDQEAALEKAQKNIITASQTTLEDMRKRYMVGVPQFTRSKISNKYEQLEILLGEFPSSFFERGADYAQNVLEICEQANGIIHLIDHDEPEFS